jgi:glutamate synthase (NADPH/NADH) large chain
VDIKHTLSQNDQQIVRTLIKRHVHYTNSSVGKNILDNWNDFVGQFVKIIPVDYRRAMAEVEAQLKAEGEAEKSDAAAKETTHG